MKEVKCQVGNENITVMSAEYSRAVRLNQHIKVHAELAQQSLYEMCKGLKEMRDDKLYRELKYQNFEEYCEKEVGFTRWQAYKFISIVENLSKDFVDSSLQIGVTKLALLAKLDEPEREEIARNVDLDNTSVKKLKEEIASLRAEKEELQQHHDKLFSDRERLTDRLAEAGREKDKLTEELDEAIDTQKSLVEQIESLEDTVQELENRPVNVAVADNSKEIQKIQEANLLEICRMGKAHSDEIEKIKADYEQKISEIQGNQTDKPDARTEIIAYQKVAENSLHNLFTAICRQNKYDRKNLALTVFQMLSKWHDRFDDLDDESGDEND